MLPIYLKKLLKLRSLMNSFHLSGSLLLVILFGMDFKKKELNKDKEYDYLAKIVIIGNSAVGKTNLLLRFVEDNYSMVHTPTIGVDFRSKIVTLPQQKGSQKKKLKLQLWDTAGQERFRTLTQTYFKGASGIIIVYSISDRKSFEDVLNWVIQLQENGVDNVPKIIVGNKCDLMDQRKVSCEEGRLIADENSCTFMEVSAKENINIAELFLQLSMSIMSTVQTEPESSLGAKRGIDRKVSNILLKEPVSKKKDCC